MGAVERYGRGIVSVDSAGAVVRFELAGSAEIALVSITEDGRVRPLYPQREGESSRFDGGPHAVEVPVSEWWLVLASAQAPWSAPTEAEAMRTYNRCRYAASVTVARTYSSSASTGNAGTDSLRRTGPGQPNDQPSWYASNGTTVTPDQACGAAPVGAGATAAPLAGGRWEDREDVILLVVSDTPVSADVLRARIEHLRVASQADLRALPQRITGDPSRPVAGYFARRSPMLPALRKGATP